MPATTDSTYLVFDTESVPDGVLVQKVKHPDLDPLEAVAKAQAEAVERYGSDFLPVTFHHPVAICVARVSQDFRLQAIKCLDAPHYRPRQMTADFWSGWAHYQARLVSFNGRCFDLPLLELAAFRYGISAASHFCPKSSSRYRYGDGHLDLMEFLTNSGAIRFAGGLNLASKLLGKPGKVEMAGGQVYDLYRQGKLQAINEYCSFDVLDTFFVFLRTRVMTGELTLEDEQRCVRDAKAWIAAQAAEQPHLERYLERWGDWQPWP